MIEKKPADFETFLTLMEEAGYTVKRGKHIKFIGPGQIRGTKEWRAIPPACQYNQDVIKVKLIYIDN